MALTAQQMPRWFSCIRRNSFAAAAQVGNRFQRPGKTLLHGFAAQPQISSHSCFLQWGFKNYRTSSIWNNSPQSTKQEINSGESTMLPSVNEQPREIPKFDPELSLEGNSERSEKSLLPHSGSLNKVPVYIVSLF